ncbi:hypothetical protein ACJJIW_20000 [Microbulbifer sp. JMSA004]|uniref:hypothetical protein n=1 Tax=unclassified Microbulbifer TaxID=2619833 RepID=UPI0024AE4820|nr:hypothetical protein [Microbulbifer sp. VAAF005]WHI46644.1 hypothetical protein P0078_23560 [Microbulbifer sp. VAAF005]
MKIYVHIGSDKTGSTAIQAALSQNRDALRANGIEYPQLFKQESHHECLFRELRSGQKGGCWLKLDKVISSKPKHLILSAEAFCNLKASEINLFKKWLNHSDICVIAYIRRADEYLESGIMQKLKTAKSYSAFKWQYLMAKYVPTLFDPCVYSAAFKTLFIKRWEKVYPNKIITRPYDKNQWESQNLILDFLSSLGLTTATQNSIRASKVSRNVTPSIAGVYATSILTRNKLFGLRQKLSQSFAGDPLQKKKGAFLSWNKRATARMISQIFNYFTIGSQGVSFSNEKTPKSIGLPSLSEVISASEDIVANQLAETNKMRANLQHKLKSCSPAPKERPIAAKD